MTKTLPERWHSRRRGQGFGELRAQPVDQFDAEHGARLQERDYVQERRTWVRLREKGGKRHEMPCHHNFDEYLHAYLIQTGLAGDDQGWLFRSAVGRRPLGRALRAADRAG